jgi:hypothetical protein
MRHGMVIALLSLSVACKRVEDTAARGQRQAEAPAQQPTRLTKALVIATWASNGK